MTLFADDPDVHVTYPVTDSQGANLTWTPIVRVPGAPDITAAWQGAVASTRDLKVPLTGLQPGRTHTLRLVIPGDNDVLLGTVTLV